MNLIRCVFLSVFLLAPPAIAATFSEVLDAAGIMAPEGFTDMSCSDAARAELSKPERSWYTSCEVTRPKAYVALAWKRNDFKKLDFHAGLGSALMSNMKLPEGLRASFDCAEDKAYEAKNSLKPVKVDCEYRIPGRPTLYTSLLYLYPKALKQDGVGLIAVVSSSSKSDTSAHVEQYFTALVPKGKASTQ